jgi:tRNA nucleotidyltransferase (CCA-adding enzyme)
VKSSQTVISFLERSYGAHCFVVGGAVRDSLVGRDIFDIDIECYNIDLKSFQKAMDELGASGVGKSFFVYKLGDIDISLPRSENKIGYGYRGFEVSIVDNPEVASRRRDFTINSLMFDTKSDEVVDFWGGLEDLHRGVLRATNPESFIEDSLRVLRAVQFGARFGFKVEKETCLLSRQISLDDLPKERIFDELKKLFTSEHLHYGLFLISQMAVDKKIFKFKISEKEFYRASKILIKHREYVCRELYPFFFLAVLRLVKEFDMERVLHQIGASKKFFRVLNIQYPNLNPKYNHKRVKRVDVKLLLNLAKKGPIRDSILSFLPDVRELSEMVGVWDRAFEIEVSPEELIKKGFRGKALGLELERIRDEKIRELSKLYDGGGL